MQEIIGRERPIFFPIPYNGALRPILMLIGIAAMFLLLQRRQKKSCYRKLLWAATGVYLFFLLYATLLSRTVGEEYSYRVEPLVTFRLAFTMDGALGLANPQMLEGIVVNLLLMMPLGYLLPQLFVLSGVRTTLMGAGISLVLELIQLFTRLGMFEVDDILCNILGTTLGYVLLLCMERRMGERLRRRD